MRTARKIIGFLIIAFIGLPILFGIIWAVGLTRASVSPEFVSDLPREIIDEVPDLAESIFTAAQDPLLVRDENVRAWLAAAAKAGVTPKKFLGETGLLDWLQNEIAASLDQVGEVLRGERRPRTIVFDLRPLKNILSREDIDKYFLRILENLPACDEEQTTAWIRASEWRRGIENLPACRPDLEAAKLILPVVRGQAVADIPDEVEAFEDVRFLPFNIPQTITLLSYGLFLIPALFILIGALIAAHSKSNFLRWSGVSVFLGALPALLLSLFAKHISLWALKFAPFSYGDSWGRGFTPELQELILDKAGWIAMEIIDKLFSPVVAVAAIVCVIGIVLFALSFAVEDGRQKRIVPAGRPQAGSPEPPAKS
ncbi:MAG: hypothetical protein AB1715_01435 [Acidobacteriota bacterium]